MKTIEEAAKISANNQFDSDGVLIDGLLHSLKKSFKDGVEFAQRWIPVEDELQEIRDEKYQILTKYTDGIICDFWVRKNGYCTNADNAHFFETCGVTHWRHINLK